MVTLHFVCNKQENNSRLFVYILLTPSSNPIVSENIPLSFLHTISDLKMVNGHIDILMCASFVAGLREA
jgi:hypothetical protein